MNEKQLTIKEIISKLGKGKCLSCNKYLDTSNAYNWKVPLCKKCRLEVEEDLEELEG